MFTDAKVSRVQSAVTAATSSSSGGDFADSRASEEAERLSRYRLVIEQGSRRGTFVYKTLDRHTGEVVKELPREHVTRLAQQDSYAAGAVIDTRA